MSLSMRENLAFQALEAGVKDLTAIVAKQGIQIAALIAVHPEPAKLEAVINPPAAPDAWAEFDAPPPVADIAIPERVRGKPGPKPRFHGLHPDSPELGATP